MTKYRIVLFITFCFLTNFQLKAQHRYLADNPIWIVNSSCNPYPCSSKTSTIYYYLNGDTIIGSYSYHKVFRKEFGEYICIGPNPVTYFGSNDTIHPVAYLRDTLKQIRKWDEFLNSDTLLYNFDLNIGDTIPNAAYGFTTVDSIDSIPVSNYFRKRFKLSNPDCSTYLFEGIGNSNGFLEPVICINVSSDCGYTLTCYGFNDTAWYPNYSSSSPCIIPVIPLGITEHKKNSQTSEITIFPNPTSSTFIINSDGRKIENIKIINLLGELLYQSDRINSKFETDISFLLKGIYIIQIQTDNGIIGKKIIKK